MEASRTHERDYELAITRCALLGATHHFDNHGHPEREQARKYHTYRGPVRCSGAMAVGYGHTQGRAAAAWLVLSGWAAQFRKVARDDRS